MRSRKALRAVAGLAMFAAPLAAQAQPVDPLVSLRIDGQGTDNFWRTRGKGYSPNGGGFLATFTVDFSGGPRTFIDYLIWCIDPARSAVIPGPKDYALWTLKDFANQTFGSKNGYDPNLTDMRYIATLVGQSVPSWDLLTITQKKEVQGSVWSRWDGYSNYGNNPTLGPILSAGPLTGANGWYVLWNGNRQTFLTYIPEPANAVLLLVGFVGLGAVATRRRRQVC